MVTLFENWLRKYQCGRLLKDVLCPAECVESGCFRKTGEDVRKSQYNYLRSDHVRMLLGITYSVDCSIIGQVKLCCGSRVQ